ncbi:MAG: DUF2721 domain-containing protein [Verrucomicrobiales bacterium]
MLRLRMQGIAENQSQVEAIAHVIQMSVAPVFLLAAISGLLTVLTNRLARIIDRARIIEERMEKAEPTAHAHAMKRLKTFSARARLVNYAITLCVCCSSTICLVVIALFSGEFFEFELAKLISMLFIIGMCSLFAALFCFLLEVRLATRSLRIGGTTKA